MQTRIILADDDEDECGLFEECIRDIGGCRLDCFNDGCEVMMKLLSLNENQLPDFIFLDLNMPLKDGIDCLRDIRQMRRFDDSDIIIYSITAAPSIIQKAYALGANLVVRKPDTVGELRRLLKDIISKGWKVGAFDKQVFVR